jgi:hypothetical protein
MKSVLIGVVSLTLGLLVGSLLTMGYTQQRMVHEFTPMIRAWMQNAYDEGSNRCGGVARSSPQCIQYWQATGEQAEAFVPALLGNPWWEQK